MSVNVGVPDPKLGSHGYLADQTLVACNGSLEDVTYIDGPVCRNGCCYLYVCGICDEAFLIKWSDVEASR